MAPPRNPLSAKQIVEILGGLDAVADLTGVGKTAVHNWIAANAFPPRFFHLMRSRLVRHRRLASPELWGQESRKKIAA